MPPRPAPPPSSLGLRGIRLLESLPVEQLDALARACAWRTCEPGRHILSREDADRDVYLIVSGRVRITIYAASGRQVTFRDLGAGELFGDVAAIDGLPRTADVVALDSTLLASMSPAAFGQLLREQAGVAERELRRLAGLVRQLNERVIDLSTLGVQNRIHAELLRLARAAGVAANEARITPAPKHADIASQVSTYREQVTRELSTLARAGLVERSGSTLVIHDVARLTAMVQDVRDHA